MPASKLPTRRLLRTLSKGLARRGRLLRQAVALPKSSAQQSAAGPARSEPKPKITSDPRPQSELAPSVAQARTGSRPPGPYALPDRLLESPVFLFSPIRSGSTLLRVLLNSHSKIFAPHEMHVRTLQVKYGRDFTAPAVNALGYIKRDLEDLLWDRVLRHSLDRSGKEILVDKTPANVLMWRQFHRIWPEARYVFLLRDPAAIINSVSSRRKVVDMDDIHAEVRGYCAKLEEARAELPGITVTYEELTSAPERETRRICEYLGVEWEPQMLEYGAQDQGDFRPQLGDWSKKIRSGTIQSAHAVIAGPRLPEDLASYAMAWGYRTDNGGQPRDESEVDGDTSTEDTRQGRSPDESPMEPPAAASSEGTDEAEHPAPKVRKNVGAKEAARDRTVSPRWRSGYARGKIAASVMFHDVGPVGPVRAPEQLPKLLSEIIIDHRFGRAVSSENQEHLLHLAVEFRGRKPDAAVTALTFLADTLGHPAAEAWLPIVLAGNGRLADAVELKTTFAPGRPPSEDYVILPNALSALGRHHEAEEWMHAITDALPSLAENAVHIWSDSAVAEEYRRVRSEHEDHWSRASSVATLYHLPFCAGTSQLISLKRAIPRQLVYEVSRGIGLLQIERLLRLPAEEATQLRMVHLHHPYPIAINHRQVSYFTVLRDPVAQIRSGFHKRQTADKIIGTRDTTSMTFAEHAEYTIANGLTNMLARQLAVTHPRFQRAYRHEYKGPGDFTAIDTEEDMFWFRLTWDLSDEELLQLVTETLDERFHLVGSMDHLAASHLAAAAHLGLPAIGRLGHQGQSGQRAADSDGTVEQRLRDANWVDEKIFVDYSARFAQQYGGLIAAVEADTAADADLSTVTEE